MGLTRQRPRPISMSVSAERLRLIRDARVDLRPKGGGFVVCGLDRRGVFYRRARPLYGGLSGVLSSS